MLLSRRLSAAPYAAETTSRALRLDLDPLETSAETVTGGPIGLVERGAWPHVAARGFRRSVEVVLALVNCLRRPECPNDLVCDTDIVCAVDAFVYLDHQHHGFRSGVSRCRNNVE